ncbi:hypothetical protein LDI01_13210 [Lentilactobacillus diolivorans]|uniref:Uncharacterized protein n=1 Tax=Lentilactobacillus diolivorans TaxID=179838 RepID=A0ABQ0XCC8_9LACO|nr:hypothetical protein LDI01_13210 [Lentilactobacillus diolivorans]
MSLSRFKVLTVINSNLNDETEVVFLESQISIGPISQLVKILSKTKGVLHKCEIYKT